MKIQHNNKEYELNIEKALELGILKPVIKFNVGDVWKSVSISPQVIARVVWTAISNKDSKVYALLGNGGLNSFSNNRVDNALRSENQILDYISLHNLSFVRNINDEVCNLIEK